MNFSGLGKESAQIQVSFCKPSLYICNDMSLRAHITSEPLVRLALSLVIQALRILRTQVLSRGQPLARPTCHIMKGRHHNV